MEEIPGWSLEDVQVFVLVLFRVSGVIMLAPLFGGEAIPVRIRAMISLVLAVLLLPLVGPPASALVPNLGIYVLAIGGELATGMILGFAASLLFTAVLFAGQLIDQELGLAMANVLDPVTNQMTTVLGQFKLAMSMVVWLVLFGHHGIIRALSTSFSAVPLMGFVPAEPGWGMLDALMRELFVSAFLLAAPAMVTMFLVTVAMAFLARIVPEMNIFMLGFSLRLLIGLLVLSVTFGVFVHTFVGNAGRHERSLGDLIRALAPVPSTP